MSPNPPRAGSPGRRADRGAMSAGALMAFVALGILVWAAFDLAGPRRTDIRRFDPAVVARLDTAMWRSYYDRKQVALFFQLAQLMREQFHFPLLRSYGVAFRAARAAFVFKGGHDRSEYRRALPDLVAYYAAIRKISATPFDVLRSAELELEWWIVHRERLLHHRGDLEGALADAAAELYRVPRDRMAVYAHERTLAMLIRDTRAATNTLNEGEWSRIEHHLRTAWGSLHQAVAPN